MYINTQLQYIAFFLKLFALLIRVLFISLTTITLMYTIPYGLGAAARYEEAYLLLAATTFDY